MKKLKVVLAPLFIFITFLVLVFTINACNKKSPVDVSQNQLETVENSMTSLLSETICGNGETHYKREKHTHSPVTKNVWRIEPVFGNDCEVTDTTHTLVYHNPQNFPDTLAYDKFTDSIPSGTSGGYPGGLSISTCGGHPELNFRSLLYYNFGYFNNASNIENFIVLENFYYYIQEEKLSYVNVNDVLPHGNQKMKTLEFAVLGYLFAREFGATLATQWINNVPVTPTVTCDQMEFKSAYLTGVSDFQSGGFPSYGEESIELIINLYIAEIQAQRM